MTADVELIGRTSTLPPLRRAAFAEKFLGSIAKHIFYTVRSDNAVVPPRPDEADAVPHWKAIVTAESLAAEPIEANFVVDGTLSGTCRWAGIEATLARAIDGQRTIEELRHDLGIEADAFRHTSAAVYRPMHGAGLMFLSRRPALSRLPPRPTLRRS
jgi:hypothetical protein